jgi:hypothetical protein
MPHFTVVVVMETEVLEMVLYLGCCEDFVAHVRQVVSATLTIPMTSCVYQIM